MATYTSNYGWTKPSGSDNVDISVLNDNLDDQDSTIHDAFLNMAPPFSESSTYAVDDIVLYTTGLYKCHTAVVTPGSWTGSTNWQVYKLSEGGSGGGGTSNYNDLTNKPSINGVTLSGNKTTSDLGITASGVGAIPSTDKGANGGVATLGNDGIVPSSQLPAMFDGDYNNLTNKPILGTAAAKDVPSAGNASLTEVVMGSDSRLSDDRNAKDVYPWAKAATKPTYTATEVGAIPSTDKGANGGVAELDSNGKVPSSQLPSYVDDVLSYASQSAFPATGETGKIYIAEDTNKTYRWSGSAYAEISASLALGETSSTAYRGDRGKTAYDHSQITGNPHGTTKSDVGLGNVPNVSTNDQEPTFTEASTRNNIASGEKLSVILGKIAKFFNDLKTVAFSGSYTDLTNTPIIPAAQVNSDWNASSGVAEILNKPSSYTPSSHTHGNIQNGGTLQTTDVAIANGDKLVVTDSSNSAKIARTSVAFDGTTTTQALSKKGTFETFSKFSGSYTDLTDKPTIPTSAGGITYDNTDSGLSATNVQGAVDEVVGKMGNVRMTKLWENSTPTQPIAENTEFNINTAGYDFVMFVFGYSNAYLQYTSSAIIPHGKGTSLSMVSGNGTSTVVRNLEYVSDTKYKATTSYNGGIANTTAVIPLAVYGIKLT